MEAIYLRTRARYRSLTWNPGVAAFCRERLDSFDLTHIYGLYDLIGPRVAGACRRIARPYIVEPMGMFLPIVRSIWMKRLYHDTLGGRLLRGASRVIATSEQERQEFLEGGIGDSKIVVRRNGIEIPGQFPPAGSFRNQWGIPGDVKLVLFLGRLVSKKSPELMLEAFSHWNRRGNGSRGSVLVMAGPDEGDGFRERLETIAAQMGLNGKRFFHRPALWGCQMGGLPGCGCVCFAVTKREFRQYGRGSGRVWNSGSGHRSLRNRADGGPARGSRRAP